MLYSALILIIYDIKYISAFENKTQIRFQCHDEKAWKLNLPVSPNSLKTI